MKRTTLLILLVLCVTGLIFADFEFTLGGYGGFGNASAGGGRLQIGYISDDFKWALLGDLSLGKRYGQEEGEYILGHYTYTYGAGNLDFNYGVLFEYYFLSWMGVGGGIGGSRGYGTYDDNFPQSFYLRGEIAFIIFDDVLKIVPGFDYLFWNDNSLPVGVTAPRGYRINISVLFRGPMALQLLGIIEDSVKSTKK